MQEIVYHTNFELEDSYWWFVARNRIVKSMIENRTELKLGNTILDVGCGTGGFAKLISDKFNPICLDTSSIALDYCKRRGLENIHNSLLIDFPTSQYDISAVTMLDVLEHIENEREVLKQVYKLLPNKGWLIATVPAYQKLWSKHDEIHHHFRRYNRFDFISILRESGFSIKFSSYFNAILFFPALLKRFIDKITSAEKKKIEPVEEVSPLINNLFTKLFLLEKSLLNTASLPFGLSIIAIVQKDEIN